MTETDELRRLLDERGVEWGNVRNDGSESDYLTEWQFEGNQGKAIAIEWAVGSGLSMEIHRYHLTPEQAIEATLGPCSDSFNCTNGERTGERTDLDAATLGRGTCHITDNGPWGYPYVCSACGASFDPDVNNGEFNYCPNCGAARGGGLMAERIIDLPTEKMTTDLRFWLREEIVRCRDCACFSVDDSDHDYRTGWWCKRWYTDMVMPDGFCAWGERKEVDG